MQEVSRSELIDYFEKVDDLFPTPLSAKESLQVLAEKLLKYGTLCQEFDNGKMVGLVAGYTENAVNNLGYISVVSVLPVKQGEGIASKLVKKFLSIAKKKGLHGVNLYCDRRNDHALKMYERLGFEKYILAGEPRPKDEHLVYWFN
jgi:ribosomal protein S18 acetylase RimI-like enzyme